MTVVARFHSRFRANRVSQVLIRCGTEYDARAEDYVLQAYAGGHADTAEAVRQALPA